MRKNLSAMEPMAERFTCFVDGKQYDFEEFFWREDGRLCVCSVSLSNYLCISLISNQLSSSCLVAYIVAVQIGGFLLFNTEIQKLKFCPFVGLDNLRNVCEGDRSNYTVSIDEY